VYEAGLAEGARIHRSGTYLVIEGPQFSTRAESRTYRKWGVDVIGMTNLPEARLAREAEVCYATLALVTDFDCWHEAEDDVSVEAVLEVLKKNATMAQRIVRSTVKRVPKERDCLCARALENAIITDSGQISSSMKRDLDLLVGKYL
jgi:5'-methylthioadenosine phosphorylase